MITKYVLENFKAFQKAVIDLGRINVFIGPNGSGKSSIGQSLLLLKQSLGAGSLNYQGLYVRALGFDDLVNLWAESREIRVGIEGEIEGSELGLSEDHFPGAVHFSTAIVLDRNGVRKARGEIRTKTVAVVSDWDRFEPVRQQKFEFQGWPVAFQPSQGIGTPISLMQGQPPSGMTREEYAQIFGELQRMAAVGYEVLRRIYLVPPIRGLEEPSFQALPNPYVDLLEPGLASYPPTVLSTLAYNRKRYQARIAEWTSRLLDRRTEAEIVPGLRVEAKAVQEDKEVNLIGEGFGLNQVIFLFTQVAGAPRASTVIIEEPEIHLHPKAQYELGRILTEVATEDGKQFILTTHSEHFLFGVLSKVAPGSTITNRDVKIFSCERKAHAATVKALTVTEDGRVVEGLPGFFEVNLKELRDALSKGE